MVKQIREWSDDFLHLLFPHNCAGCGGDFLGKDDVLCMKCYAELPETGFFNQPNNPVEQIFYGRAAIVDAAAAFYFTKDSLMQKLIVELKYRGNNDIGRYLGKLTGKYLLQSSRFKKPDVLIPIPLNEKKERKRGYNQAASICYGIADICNIPVMEKALCRQLFTETQTRKGRISRWENMQGVFAVKDGQALTNKHVLLVDDVVTTGATFEACGEAILSVKGTTLSIAALAYTL